MTRLFVMLLDTVVSRVSTGHPVADVHRQQAARRSETTGNDTLRLHKKTNENDTSLLHVALRQVSLPLGNKRHSLSCHYKWTITNTSRTCTCR